MRLLANIRYRLMWNLVTDLRIGAAASAELPMRTVEDQQCTMVGGPEIGDIYSVVTYFCLIRLGEEVDELIGSDVPTTRGTSGCTSDKKSVREAAAVKHVTVEVRRVTLECGSVSLESRGSK